MTKIDINKKPFTEATMLKLDISRRCFREWFPVFVHHLSVKQIPSVDFAVVISVLVHLHV